MVREQASLAKTRNIIFLLFESRSMATTKINSLNTSARRDFTRQLMDLSLVAIAYLGIVAIFSAATLIGCVIWLLIW
jgi:hypothetical protein